MTLIEIAVVLLILSIITPMIYGLLDWVQKSAISVGSRDIATGQLQVIGEALSRQIHAAAIPVGQPSAIVLAAGNELKFYSALGNVNGPTLLDVYPLKCGGCTTYSLVEDVTQPGIDPGPGPTKGQPTYTGSSSRAVLGSGVIPPTASPASGCPVSSSSVLGIFEYLQANGTCLPLDTALNPDALDSTSTNNQLPLVENLVITLTAVDTLRPTSTATATDTLQVGLPNIDYFNETSTTT